MKKNVGYKDTNVKLTEYTLKNKTVSWMAVILLIIGGVLSFTQLGRLEDPAFTIKQAMIITQYPGASAQEVEEEVTLPLEHALQQLPYVDTIRSMSTAGLSQIDVEMKSIYRKQALAQIWDELRRKIRDMEADLPPGVQSPTINDDFGDVFGVFMALTGDGYEYQDMANYADFLKRELQLVKGVSKVIISGERTQQISIEIDRAKAATSGYTAQDIQYRLAGQSYVTSAGNVQLGGEYLRINTITSDNQNPAEQLGNLLMGSRNGKLVYLSDVATIKPDYIEPDHHLYRFNGEPSLALGVSFTEGVNVTKIGEAINARLAELEYARPLGMELTPIYDQPTQVAQSVDSFLVSLGQAVIIVILVLMITMGWKPGILMSGILLLSILGTFIVMNMTGIELQRISLGALIIALGMLVDNAIVITEGMMIGLQRGMSRKRAAIRIVGHSWAPLLGATLIAITAFAPIGLSPDASGEFTGSLFWVLFISLFISWVLAITLTPFFGYLMFKEAPESTNGEQVDPYKGIVYQLYKGLLHLTLRFRWSTMVVMVAALYSAILAFDKVDQAFFPESTLPAFTINYWLPQGTDIRTTTEEIEDLQKQLLQYDDVKQITATIGRGAERFMLTYNPEQNYAGYGQLLIETKDYESVGKVLTQAQAMVANEFPHAFVKFERFELGPGAGAKIEARFSGPDPDVLRDLSDQTLAILYQQPKAINIRQDWRERTKVVQPVIDVSSAQRLGISQADINAAIAQNVNGKHIGLYRHGSELLPIVLRPPQVERTGVEQLQEIQIFSPVSQSYVPLAQLLTRTDLVWEDPVIKRRDRIRTLTVFADPSLQSNAFELHNLIRADIEAIPLPQGYSLEWGGEYEAQNMANEAVFEFLPLGLLLMIVINIVMFRSAKQTLVIWLTVPLAIIGVGYGLLIMGAPFSFTALLAVLSLIGMQIKNGIVLVEEIKRLQEEEGHDWLTSISNAAVSRLRPVTMAAITTILGVLPLLSDVFFAPMAVTIMFGLGFASILTLIVVPVLFALFYGVKYTSAKH
jgi:multidrug efflux pump subunit AcrB